MVTLCDTVTLDDIEWRVWHWVTRDIEWYVWHFMMVCDIVTMNNVWTIWHWVTLWHWMMYELNDTVWQCCDTVWHRGVTMCDTVWQWGMYSTVGHWHCDSDVWHWVMLCDMICNVWHWCMILYDSDIEYVIVSAICDCVTLGDVEWWHWVMLHSVTLCVGDMRLTLSDLCDSDIERLWYVTFCNTDVWQWHVILNDVWHWHMWLSVTCDMWHWMTCVTRA